MLRAYLIQRVAPSAIIILMLLCNFFAYASGTNSPVKKESLAEAAPIAACAGNVNVAVGENCTVLLLPEFIDAGSFDPDGDPLTLTLDITDPVGLGDYLVTLFVSDGTSTSQCLSNVTVEDKSGPTAVCFAFLNLSLESDGTGTLLPEEVDAGSSDNCSINLSFANGPIVYTCEDVGTTQIVFLQVIDDAGNENSCFSEITIEDVGNFCNESPTAICVSNVFVSVGNDCLVTLEPEFIDAGSFDGDGDPITLSLDITEPIGPGDYVVNLFVSDGTSTNQCWSNVTVEDKQTPTAICISGLTASLGTDGTVTIFPEDLDAGSFDNCDFELSFADGPETFNCADVGQLIELVMIVTDEGGNTNSCFSELNIVDTNGECDNTAPTAICVAALNISAGPNCEFTLLPSDLDAGSFDPDGDPLTYSLDNAGPLAPGSYTVTLTVSDGSLSNSCFTEVLVEDKDSPTAICVSELTVSLGTDGTAMIFPEDLDVGSFDNCSTDLSFTGDVFTFGCPDVGDTFEVPLTVEDEAGNSSSCLSLVNVVDSGGFCANQVPIAICVSSVNVSVGASCEIMLLPEFIDAGSFDPDGDPLTYSLDNPGPLSPGPYTVILTVSDGSLSGSCFTEVLVEDKTSPTAICLSGLTASLGPDGTVTIFPEDLDAGSFDNCDFELSFADGPETFTCDAVGEEIVLSMIVTDEAGNTNSCFSAINIQDSGNFCNESPTALCLAGLSVLADNTCQATLFPEDFDAGSFDPNSDPLTYSISPSGPFTPGTYTVTLTVSDGEFSSSCTSELIVQAPDNDGDGFSSCDGDCDDDNDDVYPGAPELCDGVDNNCNDSIDEPDNISTSFEWIETVALADLNNNSGNNGGYADFTALSATLAINNNYEIELTPGYAGGSYNERWRVYIDLNQDGVFSNPAERVVQTQGTGPQSANILLPDGTLTGTTRMRVVMSYGNFETACGDGFEGEIEDYTIVIAECEDVPGCVSYCESEGQSTDFEWIRRVRLRSINNNSGDDGGYGDYTALSTDVTPGSTYNMRLRPGFSGSSYQEYWRVWVDWNQDGDFSAIDELMIEENDDGTIVTSLTVPITAIAGTTRMRVAMQYDEYAESCGSFGEGEVEDYSVNVLTTAGLMASNDEIVEAQIVDKLKQNTSDDQVFQLDVDIPAANTLGLELAPNPAREVVNIKVRQLDQNAELTIIDQLGRVVWSQPWSVDQQALVLDVRSLDLTNGIYFVNLQTSEESIVERLIIQ